MSWHIEPLGSKPNHTVASLSTLCHTHSDGKKADTQGGILNKKRSEVCVMSGGDVRVPCPCSQPHAYVHLPLPLPIP